MAKLGSAGPQVRLGLSASGVGGLPRTYPSPGAPQPSSQAPNLLGGMMGFGAEDPVTHGPGKSADTQHLGTVVGRRGSGIATITGGDPAMHSMNQYKKGGISGLSGGDSGA